MFVTKIKSVLAVVLLVVTLASAVGMIYQTHAAEPPKDAQPDQKVLTPEEAIKERDKEKVTSSRSPRSKRPCLAAPSQKARSLVGFRSGSRTATTSPSG
jgi:hypothetical protein